VTQLGKRLGAFLNLGPEIDTAITKEFLNLITVPSGVSREEANRLLHQNRIEKLIVVDERYRGYVIFGMREIES